ncbi:hypothetical protein [Phenylobacterium sp.]|uniref:hypothetical protein n=1 Tax=Phenylobacterium sp. TaxID=1871053 RepID=UPI00374D7C0C
MSEESIALREAELRRILDDATAELEELSVVKRYMARRAQQARPSVETPTPAPVQQSLPQVGFTASRPTTLTPAIVMALKNGTNVWLTARDLQTVVGSLIGRAVPMSSISPKLTDLKNRGVIVRDDMKVALKERVPEEAIG